MTQPERSRCRLTIRNLLCVAKVCKVFDENGAKSHPTGMAALCDVTERLFKITQLRTCPSLADRYSGRKKINMDCQHA